MLSSMKNMFKVQDLRNKIVFTLFMIAAVPAGSHVPVPGHRLDVSELKDRPRTAASWGSCSLFSGGAITQFAVFALGIMPYITSRSSCRSSPW